MRLLLALLLLASPVWADPTATPTPQHVATKCITPGPDMRVIRKTSSGGFCPSGSLTDDQSTFKLQRSNNGLGSVTVSNALMHFDLGSALLGRLPVRASIIAQISSVTATDNYPGQSGYYAIGYDRWHWDSGDLPASYTCALCSGVSPVSPPCQSSPFLDADGRGYVSAKDVGDSFELGVCTGGSNDGTSCAGDAACTGGGSCQAGGVKTCSGGTNDGIACSNDTTCTGGGTCRVLSVGTHTFILNPQPSLDDIIAASQTDVWLRADVHGGPFVSDEADGMEPTPTGENELTMTELCLRVDSNDDDRTPTFTRTPTLTQTPTITSTPDVAGCCQISPGACTGGSNDGTTCSSDGDCTGSGTCYGEECYTLASGAPVPACLDADAFGGVVSTASNCTVEYLSGLGVTDCRIDHFAAGGTCAGGCAANTPTAGAATATPTRTNTQLRINTPQAPPRAADKRTDATVALLSNATTAGTQAGAFVGGLRSKSVQVTVGSCTSYTLSIEGSNDCAHFAELQSVTESTVAANTTKFATTITAPLACMRNTLSAASSCTVSTVLHVAP